MRGRIQIQRLFALALLCALGAFAGGCGGSSGNTGTVTYGTAPVIPAPQTPPNTRPSKVVRMQGLSLKPATIHVRVGQTIEWVNRDNVPHNVTSADGVQIQSGNFGPGGKYEFTAKQAATISYYCTIHPTTMQGKIVIVAR